MENPRKLPSELITLIESYLPASSCANLSATCVFFHDRWSSEKWCHTYKLHYGQIEGTNNKEKFLTRGEEFITKTQFNVSALFPSVQKAFSKLCNTIECAMLGYYSTDQQQQHLISHQNHGQRSSSDLMQLFHFFVGFKPISKILFRSSNATYTSSHLKSNYFCLASSIPAWKLACLLKEKGVDCIRCSICHQIDLNNDQLFPYSLSDRAWCSPCSNCLALVHRSCLEQKLQLMIKCPNPFKTSKRMWISYDDASPFLSNYHPACVDHHNNFRSTQAHCNSCGKLYKRATRLPKSKYEVLFASIMDPLSLYRAFSTFVHFLLCCLFIALTEGNCTSHYYCSNHYFFTFYNVILKWPRNGAFSLAWWQLQQCCMLHIFFSPRFAAIVDQLAFNHPISYFYCRLYLYFLITSAFLALSFLPCVTRTFLDHVVFKLISQENAIVFKPIASLCAYLNLVQYAVISSIVIAIFWRTNYRIFTVADAREHVNNRNWTHPIFHGRW